jgi:hypothetical protein
MNRSKLRFRRGPAVLACAASLAACASAVAPTTASAAGFTKCGDKSVKIKPVGQKATHIQVQAISVEGVSCAEAVKVIGGGLSGKPVSGWVYRAGLFEPPEGLFAQEAKKGSRKIRYAIRGG